MPRKGFLGQVEVWGLDHSKVDKEAYGAVHTPCCSAWFVSQLPRTSNQVECSCFWPMMARLPALLPLMWETLMGSCFLPLAWISHSLSKT